MGLEMRATDRKSDSIERWTDEHVVGLGLYRGFVDGKKNKDSRPPLLLLLLLS